MKIKVLLFLILTVTVRKSLAAEYYVSSTDGNDNNIGSLTLPLKSIGKINSLTLRPGDKVYFKRGEIFTGQLNIKNSGNASNYIVIDSYGNGASNPVISGSIPLSTWSIFDRNIYVADVPTIPTDINQIFVNGLKMQPARYPNQGFLKISSSPDRSTLNSSSLTQPAGYWNGATVVARNERWVYENRTILSYSPGVIKVSIPVQYSFRPGWGFFIKNKLSALDTIGEWYYDKAVKKLYLWCPQNANPNTLKVEASVHDHGISINSGVRYVTIQNITIANPRIDGIHLDHDITHIRVVGNTIKNTGNIGIMGYTDYLNNQQVQVLNNLITDTGNNGIELTNTDRCLIKNNTLKRIAIMPGEGGSGDGQYNGIASGYNSYVGYNLLDSIGYLGISALSYDTIEKNIVKNVCMVKDDGAALYCYKTKGVRFINNILTSGIGNGKSTDNPYSSFVQGIYLDDSSSNCVLSNNTIVDFDNGIFLHNTFDHVIRQNQVYNNRVAQIRIQSDQMYPNMNVGNNIITRNVFYSLQPGQLCVQFYDWRDRFLTFTKSDSNYYCNPYSDNLIASIYTPKYPTGTLSKNLALSFERWKILSGQDMHSVTSFLFPSSYYNVSSSTANSISNSSFTSSTSPWYTWGSNFTIAHDNSKLGMNGGSLKSSFSPVNVNAEGSIATNGLSLISGSFYRVGFLVMGTKNANISMDITETSPPYFSPFNHLQSFWIDNTPKTRELIFKAPFSIPSAQLYFRTTVYDSTTWIDNVTFQKVTVDTLTSQPRTTSLLITNPSDVAKTYNNYVNYTDLDRATLTSFTLAPFTSKVIIRKSIVSLSEEKTASQSLVHIYPNPTNERISVIGMDGACEVKILDLAGRELRKFYTDRIEQFEVPLAFLNPGIYMLYIKNVQGDFIRKFIKER